MSNEKYEYKNLEKDLASIAANPNFTDMERNWADELWTSLKNAEAPPSHEEIMKPNRYWRGPDDNTDMVWEKADFFREWDKKYLVHDGWRDRQYFSGRSFSDGIPPEVK